MAKVIKDRQIVDDGWQKLSDSDALPASGDIVVTTARWQKDRDSLLARSGKLGLLLGSDELVEDVKGDVEHFALIAIEFPKFADGRGYTQGRLLRERFGFGGELRAVGNVLRDQLFYMARCGFNSFELQPGKDIQGALSAFEEFSVTYQAGADDPRPLFRRA